MGDSLPWTPMNRRAKYDATSFIFGGENRKTVQTKHYKTDTSTPCLSAGVDNKRTKTPIQYTLLE